MQVFTAQDIDARLNWRLVMQAMREAHHQEPPLIGDKLMRRDERALLVRLAWMPRWIGLKAVTVFPDNPRREPPLPGVQGPFLLFDGEAGQVVAVLDGAALTRWKTAADSALGCELLSRPDAGTLLMVGAGAQAEPLVRAHLEARPGIGRIELWNRTPAGAQRLAARLADLDREVAVATDLADAVRRADIVCTTTLSKTPLIRGEWLRPGTHLDLVGAYRPDMREADDEAVRRGRLFVDSRATTVGEIGKIMISMAAGVIAENDIQGDFFDLVAGRARRESPADITVFKNGGGAHLDLMTAALVAGE